jgi:hypothetical protein
MAPFWYGPLSERVAVLHANELRIRSCAVGSVELRHIERLSGPVGAQLVTWIRANRPKYERSLVRGGRTAIEPLDR